MRDLQLVFAEADFILVDAGDELEVDEIAVVAADKGFRRQDLLDIA
jgi:hypothetical protein